MAELNDGEPVVYELTELIRAEADPADNSWALYIYGADGFHSGRQWFSKVIKYPDEEITVAEARHRAEAAIAEGHEVRVCDGRDFLVFHSENGKTIYGADFWKRMNE